MTRDQHWATHSAGDFHPESCNAGEVILMDPEGPINGELTVNGIPQGPE